MASELQPNFYTAELSKTLTTGKCEQVEQMNQLSCSAPFGSCSCSPLKDGVMTCCCAK